jgi:hypothetical protein
MPNTFTPGYRAPLTAEEVSAARLVISDENALVRVIYPAFDNYSFTTQEMLRKDVKRFT